MCKRFYRLFLATLSLILVVNCAKKGTIAGGEKDETPPEFIKAIPPNYTTNFSKKEIRIYFDEYITLKDPQKNIILSPPMDPKPVITPMGGASKYIKIKFLDTLQENTTYSINFGQSVVDNNEGNPNSFFRYVFSTGDTLDSLKIKGTITNALEKTPDSFVTIALYEIDEDYSDSIVYTDVPRYITSTLDSTHFTLENIKAGKYRLVAVKDAVSNYKYEPKQDKIGFYNDTVTLPADTNKIFTLNLFKEVLDFKPLKPKQTSKNSFIFGYEGDADSLKIKLLRETPENFETRIFPDKKKDTVHYWFKPFFKADSLIFEVANSKNYKDTIITRFKDQYKDSLVLNHNIQSSIGFNEDFILSANTPVEEVNEKLITLKDKDTTIIPFAVQLDKIKNQAVFTFEKTESNTYMMELLPEAITDFVGNKNDTIRYSFATKKLADYGKIFLTLQNVAAYPVVVQLINEKNVVVIEKISEAKEILVFDNLNPGKYNIRVVIDSNKNGKWDTGNFLKKSQPEKVSYFPKVIDVRANWELKQTFILE